MVDTSLGRSKSSKVLSGPLIEATNLQGSPDRRLSNLDSTEKDLQLVDSKSKASVFHFGMIFSTLRSASRKILKKYLYIPLPSYFKLIWKDQCKSQAWQSRSDPT